MVNNLKEKNNGLMYDKTMKEKQYEGRQPDAINKKNHADYFGHRYIWNVARLEMYVNNQPLICT